MCVRRELGLQLARQIAVVSYRSAEVYETRFSRRRAEPAAQLQGQGEGEGDKDEEKEKEEEEERQFEVCRYLDYQVSNLFNRNYDSIYFIT